MSNNKMRNLDQSLCGEEKNMPLPEALQGDSWTKNTASVVRHSVWSLTGKVGPGFWTVI